MLLPPPQGQPKLHKKRTEPSSLSLLFWAPWIAAAGCAPLAEENQIPRSIREQAFQRLRAVQQGRLEQSSKYVLSADHFKEMHIFQDAEYRDCPHSPGLQISATERILQFR